MLERLAEHVLVGGNLLREVANPIDTRLQRALAERLLVERFGDLRLRLEDLVVERVEDGARCALRVHRWDLVDTAFADLFDELGECVPGHTAVCVRNEVDTARIAERDTAKRKYDPREPATQLFLDALRDRCELRKELLLLDELERRICVWNTVLVDPYDEARCVPGP